MAKYWLILALFGSFFSTGLAVKCYSCIYDSALKEGEAGILPAMNAHELKDIMTGHINRIIVNSTLKCKDGGDFSDVPYKECDKTKGCAKMAYKLMEFEYIARMCGEKGIDELKCPRTLKATHSYVSCCVGDHCNGANTIPVHSPVTLFFISTALTILSLYCM